MKLGEFITRGVKLTRGAYAGIIIRKTDGMVWRCRHKHAMAKGARECAWRAGQDSFYFEDYELTPERIAFPDSPHKKLHLSPTEKNRVRAALSREQEGKCAICRQDLDRPEIDHCHETGEIRGLLCGLCNRRIGVVEMFLRGGAWSSAATRYLFSPDRGTSLTPEGMIRWDPESVLRSPRTAQENSQ